MHPSRQHLVTASLALGLGLAAVPAAHAAAKASTGHRGGTSSAAGAGSAFRVRDLVSDGAVPAAHTDKSLVNPWGIASGGTGPMRVADNGTGLSTAYNGDGARRSVAFKVPDGDPTGIVRNTSAGSTSARVPRPPRPGSSSRARRA